MLVSACLVIYDLYLFHLIVLLNPVFDWSNNLLSSSVDKVIAPTYNFVSVIVNVAPVGLLISANAESSSGSSFLVALLVITQSLDQVKINLFHS